jgi:DNA-binding NtrC family response regulator
MKLTSAVKEESLQTRYRVLVVDDDVSVLRGLAAWLEFDLDVVTCTSAERALELLRGGDFHAVCSDYSMPGMNGLELLERVARLPVPVACLLLTGSTAFIGRSGSANQYRLTKPADPTRVTALLTQLAETIELKRHAARAQAGPRR